MNMTFACCARVSRQHFKILCRQLQLPDGQSHPVPWPVTQLGAFSSRESGVVFVLAMLGLRCCFCTSDCKYCARKDSYPHPPWRTQTWQGDIFIFQNRHIISHDFIGGFPLLIQIFQHKQATY
jgi:sulfatase maturation enzyme AslB (radical SAM superfamily)